MIAYHLPKVRPEDAIEHPSAARLLHAGPWLAVPHEHGGTFLYWADFPEKGDRASHLPESYGPPRQTADGLMYYPPKVLPDIWDLASSERAGADVPLACGKTVTVPLALTEHRQFILGEPGGVYGLPVTEYGRLAAELLDVCAEPKPGSDAGGIAHDDPRLHRVLELAIGQRYRVTRELLNDLRVITPEDIDPLLGAIWTGDPKALTPARDGAASGSTSSGSPGEPGSASPKPPPSSSGVSEPAASPAS